LTYFHLWGFLIRKTLTSGSHLSDAARRAGPAWQRAVAAWVPCAALLVRLKDAVRTACRRPDRAPLSAPSPRLTRAPFQPHAHPVRSRLPGPKPPHRCPSPVLTPPLLSASRQVSRAIGRRRRLRAAAANSPPSSSSLDHRWPP
jgi:hypothetical protein